MNGSTEWYRERAFFSLFYRLFFEERIEEKKLDSIGTIEIKVCPNEEIKIEKQKMREEKEMNRKLFSFRKSIEPIQSS